MNAGRRQVVLLFGVSGKDRSQGFLVPKKVQDPQETQNISVQTGSIVFPVANDRSLFASRPVRLLRPSQLESRHGPEESLGSSRPRAAERNREPLKLLRRGNRPSRSSRFNCHRRKPVG